jgi:hypothetical protein
MTTTLNATTSNGLVVTPDNSGSTALQANGTTALNVSSAGIVTQPLKPAFCVNRTSTQSGSSPFIILFDNITTNVGSCYDASTGRFTAPVAGTYFLAFQSLGLTSGWSYLDIFSYKNGNKDASIISNRPTSTNGSESPASLSTSSAVVTLSANDYIDIRVTATSIYSDVNAWVKFMGYLL